MFNVRFSMSKRSVMTTNLRIDFMLILSLLMLVPSLAQAQTRRTGTVNPMSPYRTGYMVYYEFECVDVQPQFPGGEHGLVNFINKTREYPYEDYVRHNQGRVLCTFIIGIDGHVSHVQVLRSSGYDTLDREAMRVIKKMPRWEAGRISNNKVNVRCILPIAFRL